MCRCSNVLTIHNKRDGGPDWSGRVAVDGLAGDECSVVLPAQVGQDHLGGHGGAGAHLGGLSQREAAQVPLDRRLRTT